MSVEAAISWACEICDGEHAWEQCRRIYEDPTEMVVERLAVVLYSMFCESSYLSWDAIDPPWRKRYRDQARTICLLFKVSL